MYPPILLISFNTLHIDKEVTIDLFFFLQLIGWYGCPQSSALIYRPKFQNSADSFI